MKNNTKIRLRLSKQLFESLTRQVIAESTAPYTEAVKAPKQTKAAKNTPQIRKANAERKIKESEIPQGIPTPAPITTPQQTTPSTVPPVKEDLMSDAMPILLALAAGGGTLALAFARDIRNAKTPEEKKQVLKNAAAQIGQSKGIDGTI